MFGGAASLHTDGMFKRAFATGLWFYATVWAFNFLAAFAGMSPVIGVGIATIVALFVGLDPLTLIWSKPAHRQVHADGVARPSSALPSQI